MHYHMIPFYICLLDFLVSIDMIDVRTFEILLRTYDVREVKADSYDNSSPVENPRKRRQTNEANNCEESLGAAVMARPSSEARGHTGFLTFARLKCL